MMDTKKLFTQLEEYSKNSTCNRGYSASFIVDDNGEILAKGAIKPPKGTPSCDEAGHLMIEVKNSDGAVSQHCIRSVHAEMSAIIDAIDRGISLKGTIILTSMEPCRDCAKMIASMGFKKVIAEKRYHRAQESREIFKRAQIPLEVTIDETEKYDLQ